MKFKQSLTFVFGLILIAGMFGILAMEYSMYRHFHWIRVTSSLHIGFLVMAGIILLSFWLSNQKTEIKVLHIYTLILFWIGLACTLGTLFIQSKFLYKFVLKAEMSSFSFFWKYTLMLLLVTAAALTGIWRYKKSGNVRIRAGVGIAAAILLLGGVLFNYSMVDSQSNRLSVIEVNSKAPLFSADLLDGGSISLKDLRGKVVVLDFWATWCGPCKLGMPYLQNVYDHYKDSPDVKIIAVNCYESSMPGEREKNIRSLMKNLKLTLPIVLADNVVPTDYGVQGIPAQFFIDRNGIVRYKTIGFSGDGMDKEMITTIEKLRK
jgi:thiol-disulfide isomerase/thioredoxin